jgi:hypothetical protein
MLKRGLGVAVVTAATVIGAGSALAASDPSNSSQLSTQTSGTQAASAGTQNTMNVIGGGISGTWTKTSSLQGGTTAVAQRQGGGFDGAKNGLTGAAAGDENQRFGVWSNFAGTGFNQSQTAIQSTGQIYNFAVGADYRVNNWVIAGLSLGYEHQHMNNQFNQGTWDSNGATVAPYAVVQLIPNQLYLDATVGYVGNSIDLTRNNNVNTASTSGNRFFMGSNLTAALDYGKWAFRPTVGASWTYQGIGSYTETGAGAQSVDDQTIHFGRMTAGGQAGYNFNNFQPYLMALYQYDYKYDLPAPAIAYKNSALIGGGLLFSLTPRFSGGVQFGTEVGKTDWTAYTGQGTIRYQF